VEDLFKNLFVGAGIGSVYSLIGLGIVIIYKSSRIFNFAAGGMIAVGSYFFWTCIEQLNVHPLMGLSATVLLALAIGFLIERTTLRPIVGQPILAAIMMTLALSSFFDGIILLFWEGRFRPYPNFVGNAKVAIGQTAFSPIYLIAIVFVLVFFFVLLAYFKYTRTGLGMRAAAEDHVVARVRGININRVFGLSWAICSVLCSLAGVLLGMITGAASHYLGIMGLKAFPVVLCGGLESLTGCIIVGPIIGIIEVLSAAYISPYLPWKTFEEVAPYFVLMVILILKPYGLFGLKKIERI